MFKIGIGPSSSHTLGPMKAAKEFLIKNKTQKKIDFSKLKTIKVDLYGSLAMTGKGHNTDKALILGMIGEDPETVDTSTVYQLVEKLSQEKKLKLLNEFPVDFKINFLRSHRLPYHTNALKFTLIGQDDIELIQEVYYSIGGGFILSESEINEDKEASTKLSPLNDKLVPYPFKNAKELFGLCEEKNLTLPQLILENEIALGNCGEKEIKNKIDKIWDVMNNGVERGLKATGHLPGPLNLQRRANALHKSLQEQSKLNQTNPMSYLNWINLFAFAVSEENANGGQVVTSPTNGSAGVIPAVLRYFHKFHPESSNKEKLYDFFYAASAIGSLFKTNATISGAEGGCQAEIGVSSSMAAAGLTCALGGNTRKIEMAAEMAMEHFIGMTCDPVGGTVQIPCIERNGVGAVKAVNACSLALTENEHTNKVSLDRIIRVMKATGDDMKSKYKETSKGGLAKEFSKETKEPKEKEPTLKKGLKYVLEDTYC